ncbi:MAG: hypothetical protein L0G99_02300, partial [Propionibacteriales bacterium]|nr:hypothetical protein [Propionibacteriales bacterium]
MATTEDEQSGFSAAEKAAMKDRAKETRRTKGKKQDPLEALQEKIAELPADDQALAQRIHEIITDTAPELQPKTYYGMPAYAKDGKTLIFFQPASKFKVRYGTLGFETPAALDDGDMWPTSFAVTTIT